MRFNTESGRMATVKQVEGIVQNRHFWLYQEYRRLNSDGWMSKREKLWFSNAKIDSENKTLYIDDDAEDVTKSLSWVMKAVKLAYLDDNDFRRSVVQDFATNQFKQRTNTPIVLTSQPWLISTAGQRGFFWLPPSFDVRALMDDPALILAEATPTLAGRRGTYYALRHWVSDESTEFKREFRDSSNQV